MATGFDYGVFNWFIGDVVDVTDPEELSRVKVKIHGKHTVENEIAKESLPWAIVATSPSSGSINEIGTLPHSLQLGSQVVGFFLDGKSEQVPMILFSFPGKTNNKNDVSELARGKNTIPRKQVGYEPASPYGAKYPNNIVQKTKSGHVIEIDDTEGKERLHIYHKSGAYYEFHPNGDVTRKSVNNDYDIIVKDSSIWVGGNVKEHISGNYTLEVGGNFNVKIGGNYNTQVSGKTTLNSGGALSYSTGANATYKSSGVTKINGSVIRLN